MKEMMKISTARIVEDTESYTFFFEPFRVHTDITLSESTGYIKIDSCYGQYQFSWPSFRGRGEVSLKRFLFGRSSDKYEFDYVMNKFSYGRRREFEVFKFDETIESFKEKIIELRKEGRFDEELARDLWNELVSISETESIDWFISQFIQCEHLNEWFDEPWCYCITGYTYHQELMKDVILPLISKWMRENVDLDLNCKELNSIQ